MASICNRCMQRLQRTSVMDRQHALQRAFSTTTTARSSRSLPIFNESSNSELNEIFTTLREYHFIPAFIHNRERRLISRPKFQKTLEDNPRTTTIGDEEVNLNSLDTFALPNRRRLLARALNLISEGDGQDWANIPPLLQGMHAGVRKVPPAERWMEKVVRKAVVAGKTGIIMQCLQQPDRTGMTVKQDNILNTMLIGLHNMAEADRWSKSTTEKALKDAHAISLMLDSKTHGFGPGLIQNDPRTRPEVLGVFLELAAVFALKHQDGIDANGLVKAYAGRLLSRLEAQTGRAEVVLQEKSRQWPMLFAIPLWHGLRVAQDVLGSEMPNSAFAIQITSDHKAALERNAQQLESRNPKPGSYDAEALTAWNDCTRS